jgi:uncharacterized protein (DUF1015 family)
MTIIKPFAALRPAKDKAAQVSAPSYDSTLRELSTHEIMRNPYSYLHVVKPYLHFKGEKKNPEKHFPLGLEYLNKFKTEKVLIKDEEPLFYIYRLIKVSVAYTSLIASASVDDYNNNLILHASTNDAKVQDYWGTRSYHSFNHLNYVRFLSALDIINEKDENQKSPVSSDKPNLIPSDLQRIDSQLQENVFC